ncbi:hypothetical protein SCLCIDRAFT_33438 [Scleroderma citrinum Foug A]|uniref:Pre-mRNA-processing factor 19 n=1 Tax=Scleroderma citrinum Foug A TaxID=1036808 RepID=A0A0C3D4V0_9AGAM|nr:hypothetical protein SCLCIDRAFT_33438 [Scleroderma citrinum Foug A]
MYTCPEQKPSKHDLASMRSFVQEVLCFSWTAGIVLQAETLYYDLEAAPPPSGPNSLYLRPKHKPSKRDLASMRSFVQEVLCFSWTAGVVLQAETLYYDPEAASPPQAPTALFVLTLLQTLQTNGTHALVLDTFALKQQYNNTRQELSYALYAQDAASRVIARLIRERDATREALANVKASMNVTSAPTDVEMAEEDSTAGAPQEGALPKDIINEIDSAQRALSVTCKKRKVPSGYISPADVKNFTTKHTISSLHSPSPAGMTSIALSWLSLGQFLTGGNDKVVQLYDHGTDKVLASLKGHTKRVNHVAFCERDGEPTLVLSAGADKIARVWAHNTASDEYQPRATIRTHKGDSRGLGVHPTLTLVALLSLDRTYSLHELSGFTQVYHLAAFEDPLTALGIHPDGALLALGTPTSKIQICNVRTGGVAASILPPESTTGPFMINTLSFSENGYHLLAPDSLSSIAIWDLHKMKVAHSIALGDSFHRTWHAP